MVVVLAAASFLLVWLIHIGLDAIDFKPQWFVSVPSFAGIYSALHWTFDRFVWKFRLLRSFGLIKVPDLNGQWGGQVASLYNQGDPAYPVSVVIMQRWSKIVIRLETGNSRSRSVAASFRTDDLPYPELMYVYVNEPKATALESMNTHRGTAVLELTDGGLQGDYYTGRGRGTVGSIKLSKA